MRQQGASAKVAHERSLRQGPSKGAGSSCWSLAPDTHCGGIVSDSMRRHSSMSHTIGHLTKARMRKVQMQVGKDILGISQGITRVP